MDLELLISSEINYKKQIPKVLRYIEKQTQIQNTFRHIVLFCKPVLTNAPHRKKYLCLFLIKDIFEAFPSDYFQKLLNQYIPTPLLTIIQNYVEGKSRTSKTGSEDKQTTEKLFHFAVQTVAFWAKRLRLLPKSSFEQAYKELKKMKIQIPSQFVYYKKENLFDLWKDQQKSEISHHEQSPIIAELDEKFKLCRNTISKIVKETIENDEEEILMRPIIKMVREFLVLFFSKYRQLQNQETIDRDVVVVYFNIMNSLYKEICNRLYISVQEFAPLIKDTYEREYHGTYDDIDRKDMIGLAGIFKYNALTIFQRIHQKIQDQEKLLGPCKISLNLDPDEVTDGIDIKGANKSKYK